MHIINDWNSFCKLACAECIAMNSLRIRNKRANIRPAASHRITIEQHQNDGNVDRHVSKQTLIIYR